MDSTHNLKRGALRDFILGGQDGLVNVLGLLLGVATATNEKRIILIAGISALFAESISMGAVAYTSSKAAKDFYESRVQQEKKEMKEMPHKEREEIEEIYYRKGFRGRLLQQVVNVITRRKKIWLDTMMSEELRLFPDEYEKPWKNGWAVFAATVMGSLVPLVPFFIFPVKESMIVSLIISLSALFVAGAYKAKITIGDWKRSGVEMMLIGGLAAVAGYAVGKILEMI